jgi:hypothetical protein
MKAAPEILNAITDVVLAYRPDKKAKAKKRASKARAKGKRAAKKEK